MYEYGGAYDATPDQASVSDTLQADGFVGRDVDIRDGEFVNEYDPPRLINMLAYQRRASGQGF